jgi:DNA mismatch repair protein MutL
VSESGRIRVLPDALIDQIAAGEVVERPASVVRELLENALDAGATRIAVDVEEGGRRLVRVCDDGRGIHPDDLPLAVTRHATSKLRRVSDLGVAATLGFRGEALPSIAAVSRLTVRSARPADPEGRELAVAGAGPQKVKAAPPVPGTTVEVADLFYNTPARAKHLKAPGTEWGHIVETVTEAALGAPTVHFSLTHNGKAVRTFPPAPDLAGRVRQVYPKELTDQLILVEATHPEIPGLTLSGLIGRPGFSRSGREHQKLVVAGRCIRNASLAHAIYAAYETALPGGRHPAFFLRLTTPPGAVDVNVHPAKREVRLADGQALYRFVREAVSTALGGFRGNTLRLSRLAPAAGEAAPADWVERARQAAAQSLQAVREPGAFPLANDATPAHAGSPSARLAEVAAAPSQAAPLAAAPARVVGQVHNTFVLVEAADGLRIVDQHTAHERVLYERLRARYREHGVPAQRLLVPHDLALPPAQAARLARHLPELARAGLEIEPFGTDAFVVRAVPEPLAGRDLDALVADIVDDLADAPAPEESNADDTTGDALDGPMRPVLATIACHAAVKSGDPLSTAQMQGLIADLEYVENPHTCPHGRAVTALLDRKGIKALFDRNWGR